MEVEYYLLPTAYCLPLTAYCLLLTAYCLLLTAYSISISTYSPYVYLTPPSSCSPCSSINQHCKAHGDKVVAWQSRKADDADLKEDLIAYYKANPNEVMGSIDSDEMVFRYRVTETFLASGTPLSVCDVFRPLLQADMHICVCTM